MAYSYQHVPLPDGDVGSVRVGQPEGGGALTVSGAMALAKGALQSVTVRLIGEVSEVSDKPGYKAVYFTVKDERASLPCMMWNNRYRATGVCLAVGQLVELSGRFSLYEAKGRMNFDVFSVALAGEGNLRMQVANLARKLQAEGLTSPDRKRPLPKYPQVIGVVTSPRGDAVHDVLRTLRRRWPLARVVLAGVPVEGAVAPSALCEGLRCVVSAGAQVVLFVRGGGSFEDMLPFSDESVARMVAACPVPVVTGIGHEPDTCIADMVADVRASTPTQAAQFASPSPEELQALFDSFAKGMAAGLSRAVSAAQLRLSTVAHRPLFTDPEALLANQAIGLDQAWDRLARVLPRLTDGPAAALGYERARLRGVGAGFGVQACSDLEGRRRRLSVCAEGFGKSAAQSLSHLRQRLLTVGAGMIAPYEGALSLGASRLHDLSPLTSIARGFAMATTEGGRLVRSVGQVSVGQQIEVTLVDGVLDCTVAGKQEKELSWSK